MECVLLIVGSQVVCMGAVLHVKGFGHKKR